MDSVTLHPELVDYIPGGLYEAGGVRLSVCIMAHEARRPMLAALVDALTAQGVMPAVSVDRQPFARNRDRRAFSLWPNALSAWSHWPDGATHHMVIQEDARVCADFVATMAHLAALVPGEVVVPYCEYPAVTRAREAGDAWMLHSRGIAGLCSMWSVNVLADALAWIAAHIRPEYWIDDARFNAYLQAHGRWAYITVPSLVDHLCPLREQSLLSHGGEDRVAAWYIGPEGRGLEVDWTRGLAAPGVRLDGFAPMWLGEMRDYWIE